MSQLRGAIHRDRVPASAATMALGIVAMACLMAALASVPLVVPSDVVNVNTATSEKLANDLEIDIALADALISERERLGSFGCVKQALAAPVVPRSRHRTALAALKRLDIQSAGTDTLIAALEIPRVSAERLMRDRAARPEQRWSGPAEVLGVTALEPSLAEALRARLIVRTPGRALAQLLLWAVLGCACLWAMTAWQRRIAPTSDSRLTAAAIAPAGLALAVATAYGDPIRDRLIVAHVAIALVLGAVGFMVGSWIVTRTPSNRAPNRHAPSLDPIAWAVLVVWGGLCMLTHGGARLGMSGIAWCGPWLILWTASGLIRRYAGLGPDRLHAATFGLHHASKTGDVRTTLAWAGLPMAAMVAAAVATRDMGVAMAAALSVVVLMYALNLRAASLIGAALSAAVFVPVRLLDGAASTAVLSWSEPWVAHGGQVPRTAAMYWAIASGGPFGTGLGLAPDAALTGVSAFAAMGEQLGTLGIGLVLLCIVILEWRASRLALLAGDDGRRLLGVGAFSLVAAYAALAVGGELGVIPDFGTRLPFVADSRIQQTLWFALLGALVGLSGGLGPVGVGVDRTVLRRRLQELVVGSVVVVLGGGTVRAAYIATYGAERIAAHPVRHERSDASAAFRNPRLAAVAATIERGNILDVSGRVVATSSLREISRCLSGDAALARRYYRAGRYYPLGPACAGVIGLWTRQAGAVSGIERTFDVHLRGYEREAVLLPLYRAKDLPDVLRPRQPRGGDVVLTINAVLQEDAYRILARAARREGGVASGRAALVVLSALTAHPIVAASVPSFDPNRMVLRSADARSLKAQVLATPDQVSSILPAPPGPFKIASALAAGERGVEFETACAHSEVDLRWDDGGVERSMALLQDDPRDAPHGRIGMGRAVRHSCNVWFGRMAAAMGAQAAYGGLVGILGPGAMPSRETFGRMLPAMFCGLDGMMVTPLQSAGLAASLTTGYAPLRLDYVLELRYADNRKPSLAPLPIETDGARRLPPGPVSLVKRALADSVSEGPAAEVFSGLRLNVAGKAASVRVGDAPDRTDAWFVGFAPVRTPAFAFACWIENGQSGTRTAGAVVRDMLREMAGP